MQSARTPVGAWHALEQCLVVADPAQHGKQELDLVIRVAAADPCVLGAALTDLRLINCELDWGTYGLRLPALKTLWLIDVALSSGSFPWDGVFNIRNLPALSTLVLRDIRKRAVFRLEQAAALRALAPQLTSLTLLTGTWTVDGIDPLWTLFAALQHLTIVEPVRRLGRDKASSVVLSCLRGLPNSLRSLSVPPDHGDPLNTARYLYVALKERAVGIRDLLYLSLPDTSLVDVNKDVPEFNLVAAWETVTRLAGERGVTVVHRR